MCFVVSNDIDCVITLFVFHQRYQRYGDIRCIRLIEDGIDSHTELNLFWRILQGNFDHIRPRYRVWNRWNFANNTLYFHIRQSPKCDGRRATRVNFAHFLFWQSDDRLRFVTGRQGTNSLACCYDLTGLDIESRNNTAVWSNQSSITILIVTQIETCLGLLQLSFRRIQLIFSLIQLQFADSLLSVQSAVSFSICTS